MKLYFGHNIVVGLPAQAILMLILMAGGPIDLPAQGPTPAAPGAVVRAYRKMDSEGEIGRASCRERV